MFRVVQKLVKPSLIKTTKLNQVGHTSSHQSIFPSLSTVRFYSSDDVASESVSSSSSGLNLPVAIEMIKYGFGLARAQKSSESYAQGLFVMEQCLSATSTESENTKGVILLAMSKLLSESGDLNEAMEKLQKIQDLGNSSLGVRVAAIEGLIGLKLELGEDITSSELADKCVELLKTGSEDSKTSSGEYEVLQTRVNGIKGLVELVNGSVENAGTSFQEDKGLSGNVMLSHGELLHATGNLASAKEFYQKAIQEIPEADNFGDLHSLATCNMVPVEVLLGATCALGQLEAHSGNFSDAEEILTRALTKAEEHFGPHHPKVGVILTCIALMFRHKAKLEHSSALLIQEVGLILVLL
ncbi:Tetratricopeptide repeat (TPR)-like superfamily protein [Thalictrum thalictroides]|uniref:Tetratricopeptide repeat (TPR)-like superfamily protein n=1 Tax=Thalictrum thalictroides TaxID=46969 RepID=A0A7J6XFI6_THATH|nr:Tetratricopeptide repeat (TPR)-like superfamily protein [Thalictrum thalictroides]